MASLNSHRDWSWHPLQPVMELSQILTLSPGLSLGLVVLAVLVGLTGFGIYTAFGPPAQRLSDPFDDHED